MDLLLEQLGAATGNTVAWLAESGVLFLIFGLIWIAFGAAMVSRHESLDEAWIWIRQRPLIGQVLAWLLLLPVMLGLWIWERTWPLALRAILVVGIAGWNLLVFLPSQSPA